MEYSFGEGLTMKILKLYLFVHLHFSYVEVTKQFILKYGKFWGLVEIILKREFFDHLSLENYIRLNLLTNDFNIQFC